MPPAVVNIKGNKISIEFSNGLTYGPVENNPTTEFLCKMIANLEGRLAKLESRIHD